MTQRKARGRVKFSAIPLLFFFYFTLKRRFLFIFIEVSFKAIFSLKIRILFCNGRN